ncbi:MAG: hypothetical protein KDA78_04560 [Planctomycetaceae bacterium]|nr:hypothetical protein [Planctomycetaceae bacterium]
MTDDSSLAREIVQPYHQKLEYTAPERTIHQLREEFLKLTPGRNLEQFTSGMRFLLENRYLKRLNDERLELSPEGRAWLMQDQ